MGDIRVAAAGGRGLVCSDIIVIVCKLFGLLFVQGEETERDLN